MEMRKEKETPQLSAENTKFGFTGETLVLENGPTLYRIVALRDFGDIKKGTPGGFIESEKNLDFKSDAWVAGNAKVYDHAEVSGNAKVYGNVEVFNSAKVYGNANIYDHAKVYDYVDVYDDALVLGHAWIYGNAQVFDNAKVYGNAQVSGNAKVYGDAEVSENYNFRYQEQLRTYLILHKKMIEKLNEIDKKSLAQLETLYAYLQAQRYAMAYRKGMPAKI
ncbi:MAG: hypothetical protein QXS03_02150 [Candidatus Micrarchaeaceae archaeon]